MNREQFNKAIERLASIVNSNLTKKNDEYADANNVLQHFEKGAKKRNKSREQMLLDWATKHEISIDDIVTNINDELPSIELLDEKIGDLITYYTILYASIYDRLNNKGREAKAIGQVKYTNEKVEPIKKERTIKEWFESVIDVELREKLLNNLKNSPDYEIDKGRIVESLSIAIESGFYWYKTEQGDEYWEDIYKKARKNEIPTN